MRSQNVTLGLELKQNTDDDVVKLEAWCHAFWD